MMCWIEDDLDGPEGEPGAWFCAAVVEGLAAIEEFLGKHAEFVERFGE